MQPRISLITLGVANLGKAVDFYTRVVGWTRSPGPPEIAFFDLNGLIFSLYPNDALAADIGLEPQHQFGYKGFTLAHNVGSPAEVDELFARLERAGAKIIKPPEKVFWGGYSGYFADPDGHHWEIAHNPFWTIMDDGRIDIGDSE